MSKELTKSNVIGQFAELVFKGIELWTQAGKIAAEAIDADPEWPEKVKTTHPEISLDVVYAFDRIGRGQLHPKLLVNDCPGYVRLRNLPLPEQERFIENPVDLLVKTPGGWETLRVSVLNLTPAQARQVFDKKSVRTLAAQRAFLESDTTQKELAKSAKDEPYRVVGNSLVILQPCKLDRRDIARLLVEMEK